MRGARAWPPPSHRRVVYPPAPSAHVGTYLAESHTRSRIGRPPLWPERRPRGGYHRAAHRTACGSLSISGTRPNGSWRIELTSGVEATADRGWQCFEDPLHRKELAFLDVGRILPTGLTQLRIQGASA